MRPASPTRLLLAGIPLAGIPLAGIGVLTAQILYAAKRGLPSFDDLDPSGTFGSRRASTLRMVAMGDSTVTGAGLDDADDVWIRRVARHLARHRRVRVISLARGGARARHVRRDQLPRALELRPDLVLLSVGGNDALRGTSLRRLQQDLDAIVSALTSSGSAVVLLGVGDLGTIPRLPPPLRSIARVRGRQVDRIQALVAAQHPRAGKADAWAVRTTEAFRNQPELFAPDLFHASPAGHREWARIAIPAVESVLATS